MYEVIAEPQEQTEQAPQEFHDDPAQGPEDTSTEQQPEGKPWCTSYYFKFMTPIYVLLLVHQVQELFGTLVA